MLIINQEQVVRLKAVTMICPVCKLELLEHNTTYWTGMKSAVIRFKMGCYRDDSHSFEVTGKTEDEMRKVYDSSLTTAESP